VEKRNNELAKRMNRTPPKKMVEEQKKMYNDIVNLLKQKKYRPLFTAMQSDGVYLFLRCRASDNKMSLIKVINSETGKEVSNFIQPSNFYLDSIKNGYAYLSTTPKDGYPIVQKYRINPTVYGK
jgi:DNA replication initiation complex subunit (GINS family)